MNDKHYCKCMEKMCEDLIQMANERIKKIGAIVSVKDQEHPEYMEELFFVIGVQQNFQGDGDYIAIMDRDFKTFIVHIDNVILRERYTIDDMFPPRLVVSS